MLADPTLIEVPAICFFATLVRSSFGFGEALFAVPLLALMIPIQVAVVVAGMISVTVALVILAQDWRMVHVRSAGWLLLSTLFGIPLGLLLLKNVAEPVVKLVLAVIILVFALYSLSVRRPPYLQDDRFAWLFGFVAGVLGGAYGMNGPPLVLYGSLRRWSPMHFRATLQGYFLFASAFGLLGYWTAGLFTSPVFRYYAVSMPAVLAAIFIGRAINRRLEAARFATLLNILLLVVGSILLLQVVK